MTIKRIFSASFYLRAVFVISLFVLIFISGLTYKHALSLDESTKWVMHTYRTNVQLEQLFSYLKDAETNQRGFLITRDSLFLEPYYSSRQKVNNAFIQLKKLTETKEQQQGLDTLYQLINARFIQLEVSLSVIRDNSDYASLLKTSLHIGKDIMDNIRRQVARMSALEMAYLEKRQADYDRQISLTPLFSLLLLSFALSMFIFSFWRINKDLYILRGTNEQLRIHSESMAHAEEIGEFSSWHWNLKTNKLGYSDNQFRLLGCQPQAFEPTFENFLAFVHPDDHSIAANGFKQVVDIHSYPDAVFRIIRKDGAVRHFKALSKLVPDMYGSEMLIGFNMDITGSYLNNVALEERNRELEQKNKELASFNHVASHDLQEPLRIVQTYISRLTGEESDHLSDKVKDYISRIKMAVTRMRILIDALLLFSRTNRVDNVFEMISLDLLLENAKQDLAQSIEQKNATIMASHLPTLKVIPFQIQQLFINLMGNSIKYSRPDVPLRISIKCEKITDKEIPVKITESTKKYYRISVEDNGIGFEQQYAEHIFTLFQRLHHDSEYEGTGIGLAICQKIAENHGGFITAEGRPGEGSTFSVYLPA